jgi:hypothetical protein
LLTEEIKKQKGFNLTFLTMKYATMRLSVCGIITALMYKMVVGWTVIGITMVMARNKRMSFGYCACIKYATLT